MNIEARLDHLHDWAIRKPLLQRYTVMTRLLLAIGYIPSGLTKMLGAPFTQLSTETSIGYFFDALYQSGFYYNFLGMAQVLAAVLLLIPRTAALGALCYFPIALNIVIITYSMSFAGTTVITSLMLLASIYLLCWEYDKLKVFWPRSQTKQHSFSRREYLYQAAFWSLSSALGYLFLALMIVAPLQPNHFVTALVIGAGGGAFGLANAWYLRHARFAATDTTSALYSSHKDLPTTPHRD
ncbi:MAG: DoxX family protein [Chloroflexota bacterium]